MDKKGSPFDWHAEFMDQFADVIGPAIWVVDGETGCPGSQKIINAFIKAYDENVLVCTYSQRQRHKYDNKDRVFTYGDRIPCYADCRLFIVEEYTFLFHELFEMDIIIDQIFKRGGTVILFGNVSKYTELIFYFHKKATRTFHVPRQPTEMWLNKDKMTKLRKLFLTDESKE